MKPQDIPNCNYPYLSLGWLLAVFKDIRGSKNIENLPKDIRFPLKQIVLNPRKWEMEYHECIMEFHPHLNHLYMYRGCQMVNYFHLSVPEQKRRLLSYIGLNGPIVNTALRQLYQPPLRALGNTLDGIIISGYDFNNLDDKDLTLNQRLNLRKGGFNFLVKNLMKSCNFTPILIYYINAILIAYLYDLYKGDIVQQSYRTKQIFDQLDAQGKTKDFSRIFNEMKNGTFKFDISQWVSQEKGCLLPVRNLKVVPQMDLITS